MVATAPPAYFEAIMKPTTKPDASPADGQETQSLKDVLDAWPEPSTWYPSATLPGERELAVYSDGEDEEGNPVSVQLVERGLELAEQEQAFEGSKRTSET